MKLLANIYQPAILPQITKVLREIAENFIEIKVS